MPLTEDFMVQNLDLLNRIEMIAKNLDENIAFIGEIELEQMSTLEKLSGGIGKKGEEAGLGASMSSLTMSINTLAENIKGKDLEEKGETALESKSIAELGTNTLTFGKSMVEAIPYFSAARGSLSAIANDITTFVKEISKNISEEELARAESISSTLAAMTGDSIFGLAKGLVKSVPLFAIARPFIPFIANTIKTLIRSLAEDVKLKDTRRAAEAAEIITTLSGSLLKFAGNLALSTPALLIGLPALGLLSLTAKRITKIADTLAEKEENIKTSTGLINRISLSLVGFAGAIAGAALLVSTVGTEDVGALAALFGGMALSIVLFNQLGKSDRNIGRGALSLLAMSASIGVFALSYTLSAELIKGVGIEGLGMTLLALTGVGAAFFLAGSVWDKIALGSLAFGMAGLSMFLLAPNIKSLAETLDEYPHALWQIPLSLIGIGTAFALAGIPVVAGFIALGALSLGLAGGALWVIGKGIGAFMDAIGSADEDSGEIIESTLKGVISGFGKGFSELSLTEALTLPLKIPLVAAMGGSLALLGLGLGKYKSAAAGWDDDDTDKMAYMLSELSRVFALSGSTDGMAKMFGFPIGKTDTERGIASTMRMGRNLKTLASGIKEWQTLALTQEEIQSITNNISRVMEFIPAIFASIGMRERESENQFDLFGIKFGVPFTSTDTELGISSTRKMGDTLKNLADGILGWKTMKLTPSEVQLMTDNIGAVLHVIPSIFAGIGARERESDTSKIRLGGLFGGISFDNPFSKGDTELGIASTRELGGTLKDLADGVLAWKTGGAEGISPEVIGQIKSNISSILNVIPQMFADVGRADKETEGAWFWSEGDMERGIEIVDDMSDPLKSLVRLMNKFKEIERPDIQGARIGRGIKSMLSGLTDGLVNMEDGELDKLERLIKPLKKLPGIFKDVNEQIKENVDYLGNLPSGYLENFETWTESLERMSMVNTANLEQNMAMSQKLDKIGAIEEPSLIEKYKSFVSGVQGAPPKLEPKPVETPNVIAEKDKESEQSVLMEKLIGAIDQLIQVGSSQSLELTAIKTQLQLGIRTIDANPLG